MHLDVIVSYGRKPFDTISITEVPFFTGKPYIISSDSVMPEKFRLFMEKQAMRAAIFQPVNIDNRTQMYVCFFDEKMCIRDRFNTAIEKSKKKSGLIL